MKTDSTEVVQAEEAKIDNVGFELSSPKVEFEKGEVTVQGDAKHVGQIGSFQFSYAGRLSAKPILKKMVDLIEKAIPGDQTSWANIAKAAIDGLK